MTLAKQEPQEERSLGITQATLTATTKQLSLLEAFVSNVLRKDEDYGVIPGTRGKSTLLKPGATNIISAYNCHSEPQDPPHEILDLEKGFIFYRVHVDVVHNETGLVRARGFGSCSSYEEKYRYRQLDRLCPSCKKPAIIKGKEEFGGGWLCYRKRDGCGAKFEDGDLTIEDQPVGRVVNEDPMEQANTILKMAVKRAEVDAALRLPGVARFFTQDIEDMQPTGSAQAKEAPPPAPANPAWPRKSAPDFISVFGAGRKAGISPTDVLDKVLKVKDWAEWVAQGGTKETALKRIAEAAQQAAATQPGAVQGKEGG